MLQKSFECDSIPVVSDKGIEIPFFGYTKEEIPPVFYIFPIIICLFISYTHYIYQHVLGIVANFASSKPISGKTSRSAFTMLPL